MSGPILRLSSRVAALVLACIVFATSVEGQVTVVPTFPVGPSQLGGRALNTEVAVGTDGSLLFAWTNTFGAGPLVAVRRMSAAGLPLGPPRTPLGQLHYVHGIAAEAGGGYTLVSDDLGTAIGGVFGRRLDAVGEAVGGPFVVSDVLAGGVTASAVATLPTGAVFAWVEAGSFYARLYDETGAPRGPSFVVDPSGSVAGTGTIGVAARPGGGFVIAWSRFAGSGFLISARVYDADGVPETGVITVATGGFGTAVAVSPLGGFAVSAFRFGAGFDGATDVIVYRVADDGAPLGSTSMTLLPSGVIGLSNLAFDAAGNALVVWAEYQFVGDTPAYLRNRGRGLAADGTPLSHPFLIAAAPVEQVRTAVLPNDTFVNAWVSDGDVLGNVVRLCTPSVATCGDGVAVAQCEECDDGAGNSDTTPDACRSDCSLPVCGDGIVDVAHGEECDDQNANRCDGCDECRLEIGLVCGDGAVVPGCSEEQCDDGNATVGDGCDPACTLEPVPGGGGAGNDCFAGFAVDNPANVPLLDKHGAFNATQVCTDDDPRCDFDGGVPGGCTFRLRICANLTDLDRCTPPTRLASWTLVQPSAAKAAKHPDIAAVRAALALVPGAIVGPDQRNVCSDLLDVRVPLRGTPGAFKHGKLGLKSSATTYEGDRDNDKLKLICLPSP